MTIDVHMGVVVKGTLTLDEAQLRALDALVGYGFESFLAVFYTNLGKAYLQPHEEGLRKLFDNIKDNVPPALAKAHEARKTLKAAIDAHHGRIGAGRVAP